MPLIYLTNYSKVNADIKLFTEGVIMKFVWEHNGDDTLLYSVDFIGAYIRGENLDVAISKAEAELRSYSVWAGKSLALPFEVEIVQEKESDLQINDADSDVLFDCEKEPLTPDEYAELKALALKSASDFHKLYSSIADKSTSCLPTRKTFYGNAPITAHEMYEHTKNVNTYYFGEIGIDVGSDGTIFDCRQKGFELLEQTAGFMNNTVIEGSYAELWSVRKMLRRFLWHDRIHAKAMYRMAVKTFGADSVQNTFKFIV